MVIRDDSIAATDELQDEFRHLQTLIWNDQASDMSGQDIRAEIDPVLHRGLLDHARDAKRGIGSKHPGFNPKRLNHRADGERRMSLVMAVQEPLDVDIG